MEVTIASNERATSPSSSVEVAPIDTVRSPSAARAAASRMRPSDPAMTRVSSSAMPAPSSSDTDSSAITALRAVV